MNNQLVKYDTAEKVEASLDGAVASDTVSFVIHGGGREEIYGDIPNGWMSEDSSLTSLTIGTSCTSIGSSAFYYCFGLYDTLVLPDSLTTIGSEAFYFCDNLHGDLTISKQVTDIGSYSFKYCGFTGTLTLPDGLATIGIEAFSGVGFTGSLVLPDSLTSIGAGAFFQCNLITEMYSSVDTTVFEHSSSHPTNLNIIYYKAGTTGWTNPWNGVPTAEWTSYPDPMP